MNIQDSQPKGQVRSTRAKDRDGKGFSYTVRNETTSSDEWLIAAKEKEMTTKARLKTLRRAYEIENDMMMGPWKTEVEKLFSIDKIQGSFRATWLCYIQAVLD